MKSTLEQLTGKEREALARLHETEGFNALRKICELEIASLGKDALIAPDFETVKYYSGQATMARDLPRLISQLHKDTSKSKKI